MFGVISSLWAVSSVGRASRLHRECRRFESCTAYHTNACVAQLVEHLLAMQKVAGSRPATRSNVIRVMKSKEFTILNEEGLHARPCAVFVKTANQFESDLRVTKAGVSVDGKSILGLMTLGAGHGSKIVVEADGADESKMIKAIQKIIKNKFYETENTKKSSKAVGLRNLDS